MPRVVLRVGAMEGVGLVERGTEIDGAGVAGCVLGVGMVCVAAWSVEVV